MRIIAFTTSFWHNSQVFVQVSTFFLVVKKVLVDCLVTDGEAKKLLNYMWGLFRAEVQLDQVQHCAPLLYTELGAASYDPPSGGGIAVGNGSSIVAGWSTVSGQFPGYSGGRSAHLAGDLWKRTFTFQKSGYGIPFFLGELSVLQRCIPFLGRIRILVVSRLSFFRAIPLHLLLECGSSNNWFKLTKTAFLQLNQMLAGLRFAELRKRW